jgi:hypothetical protein
MVSQTHRDRSVAVYALSAPLSRIDPAHGAILRRCVIHRDPFYFPAVSKLSFPLRVQLTNRFLQLRQQSLATSFSDFSICSHIKKVTAIESVLPTRDPDKQVRKSSVILK